MLSANSIKTPIQCKRKKVWRHRQSKYTMMSNTSGLTEDSAEPRLLRESSKRITRAARQASLIDGHVNKWRDIVGASAKVYCISLYKSALEMDSDTAFRRLSDAHDRLDEVLSNIGTVLNDILEVSGTNCKEYRQGQEKFNAVKECVAAVFDLWEAASEDLEGDYPRSLERTFARGGFKFQGWGEGQLDYCT